MLPSQHIQNCVGAATRSQFVALISQSQNIPYNYVANICVCEILVFFQNREKNLNVNIGHTHSMFFCKKVHDMPCIVTIRVFFEILGYKMCL